MAVRNHAHQTESMTTLSASDLVQFQRQYRFAGGRLRRIRVRNRAGEDPTIDVFLSVRPASAGLNETAPRILLRLTFLGVDEFRFQKRPTIPAGKIPDCRFGYFQGQFFVTFDAWSLSPGEVPKVHDYRASDAYIASRDLRWEVIERKKIAD
jgi:hypothetical protein